jgi:ABC-type multidrug transport system permease subunit
MNDEIKALLSNKPSTTGSLLGSMLMSLILRILILISMAFSIMFFFSWIFPNGISNRLFVSGVSECNEIIKKVSLYAAILFLIVALVLSMFNYFIKALIKRNEFIEDLTQALLSPKTNLKPE